MSITNSSAAVYKFKRIIRKRSSVLLILSATLFFLYQYTTITQYTQDQLSQLSQLQSVYQDSKTGVQQTNLNELLEEDSTVPFYKSKVGLRKSNDEKADKRQKIKQILMALETDKTGTRLKLAHDFFDKVFNVLQKGEPTVPKLGRYKTGERIYHAGYDSSSSVVFSEEYLRGFLDMTEEEVESLKKSHSTVVKSLPSKVPSKFYSGNGIVYVGGGKFNWLALLSIKSLRSLGSKLPVEILIPTEDEYEIELCTRVFPALGAKCILLSHALGEEAMNKFSFKGYQYKALALIVSSFENVLLLDSDNIPVHAPDYLFENEPFISSGLITWPDFWRRATSPHYYEIAGIDIGKERVRFGYEDQEKDSIEVPLHDRKGTIPDPTSESGQLMISKSSHTRELFLALYYNLYGPDYYYPLFSQGSDGEGDKETFLAATVALGSSYYQVKQFLNAFGHFNIDHEFIGTGMGQYDPVEDYAIESSKQRQKETSKELNQNLPGVTKQPRILFVHANFPKLNPVTLKEEGKIFERTGDRLRLYGPGMAKRVGYDFELIQWRSMHFLVCDLKIEVEAFNGQGYQTVCKEILDQLEYLENTVKDNERD